MTQIKSEVDTDKPFDLVINGSSAGLTGDFFPEENIPITSKTYFYDLNYSLTETPFCKWAIEKSDNVTMAWECWYIKQHIHLKSGLIFSKYR